MFSEVRVNYVNLLSGLLGDKSFHGNLQSIIEMGFLFCAVCGNSPPIYYAL